MAILASVALVAMVVGHGFVIYPPSRALIDNNDPRFHNGSFPEPDGKPGCEPTQGVCGCWCTNGTSECTPAQSCFWFSQGCSIGCPKCDGVSARTQKDLCSNGMKPVICDSRLRTYNVNATCATEADKYQHNPWRAPGSAPIFDPCGKAGGGNQGPGVGPGAAFFTNTSNAKEGDLGSKVLPPYLVGTSWKAGSVVNMRWGMRANHGGGYQYRLCPKTENLTEDCFKQNPLAFNGQQSLLFKNGTQLRIPSAYAYENGTGVFVPASDKGDSMPGVGAWARNPIPDNQQGDAPGTKPGVGLEFPAPCNNNMEGPTKGLCSGERPFHIAIVDGVRIPATMPAGEYVLGFRWDCEETAQIWTQCADVTITA